MSILTKSWGQTERTLKHKEDQLQDLNQEPSYC